MDTRRLDIMDAQRFDISKRNSSRHAVSMNTESTLALTPPNSLTPSVCDHSSSCSHDDPTKPLALPSRTSSVDTRTNAGTFILSDTSSSSATSSLFSSPSTIDSTRPSSPSSTFINDDTVVNEDDHIDTIENSEYTTSSMMIRPVVRDPLAFFLGLSRPSSPFLRPPIAGSQPTGPSPSSSARFATLNCFGSARAFENDVDRIQEQWRKESTGEAEIKIAVTQETTTQRELWTEATQEVLYDIERMETIRRSAALENSNPVAEN